MTRFPLLRTPAVRAMLIQLSSFLLVLGMAYGVSHLPDRAMPIVVAALLQGVIAAALSPLAGLALWWLPIQSVFPVAIMGTLSLQIPSGFFLAGFLLLLGLYWSAFRTQVPFYPSGRPTWEAVAALLPADRPLRFIDIGSGLGGITLHLSRTRPDSEFTGIEIAPLPWLVSRLRSAIARNPARFVRGDYGRLDFAAYDVVFAYLSPAAMPALWQKASAEMRSGTLLLSVEFSIPGIEPDLVSMPEGGGPALYGWHMRPHR